MEEKNRRLDETALRRLLEQEQLEIGWTEV